MIIFGTHKFGWIDQVDDVGTVATSFFHVMYIPLIPFQTSLMLDDDMGISLPLSIKSIIVAYVRSFLFWTAFMCVVSSPATFGITCVLGLPFIIGYFVMPMLVRKASAQRAEELTLLACG